MCTGICGSLLSCEAHSIFHLYHLAGTSMSKTLKYDPRVCIPSISVHLRGTNKRVYVPVGIGLKLLLQLTVFIGILYMGGHTVQSLRLMLHALLRPRFTVG